MGRMPHSKIIPKRRTWMETVSESTIILQLYIVPDVWLYQQRYVLS